MHGKRLILGPGLSEGRVLHKGTWVAAGHLINLECYTVSMRLQIDWLKT